MTATFTGECTPLESRAETASLEGLQHERRLILSEYAALKALHGPNGKWDNRRKAFLETAKIRCRMECQARQEKTTEAYIDALAHADAGYLTLIDEGIAGATRYVELDIAITELEERINSRQVELLAYNSEIRLAK